MHWYIADIHAGHYAKENGRGGVIFLSKRPFGSIAEMEKTIVDNINRVAKPDDTLYIIGDASFYNGRQTREFIARIKCKVVLIQGNHDKQVGTAYDAVFSRVHMRLGGLPVILSHYPYRKPWYRRLWNFIKGYNHDRYFTPDDGKSYLIHGHTHSTSKGYGRRICVCVDATGFKPLSEKEIISIIHRREYLRLNAKVLKKIADKIHRIKRWYRRRSRHVQSGRPSIIK